MWGTLYTKFIHNLPKRNIGYKTITICVDRFSRKLHFVNRKINETSIEDADKFIENI